MKCEGCKREFVFTMTEHDNTSKHDNLIHLDSVMLCFTCFGQKHGIESFKIKQIADLLNSTDEHSGLPMAFLWEVPYEEWSPNLKAGFDKAPPHDD